MSEQTGILDDYLPQDELAKLSNSMFTRAPLSGGAGSEIGPPVTWKGREPIYNLESIRTWLRSREQRMPRERQRDRRSEQKTA